MERLYKDIAFTELISMIDSVKIGIEVAKKTRNKKRKQLQSMLEDLQYELLLRIGEQDWKNVGDLSE